jgi:23S rRNA pseudouridine1911/1915/1917 synthase
MREFEAPARGRLDRLIADALPDVTRSQARRLVDDGRVTVEGTPAAKAGLAVRAGAVIRVDVPARPDREFEAGDIPLHILHEDEHTLVLDKQPGLVVHPAPGLHAVTLIEAVSVRYPEVREIEGGDRGGIVHRLDRDTSGVIVVAKSEASQHALKEQWRNRDTCKIYLAIVEGAPDPPEGIIEAPIAPLPNDPRRRGVVEGGQSARSQYRVLEQYGEEAALVEVQIFTGRTHQIRVHMEAIGNSVIGDELYGRPSELINRQALHAWRLGVALASDGEWREFEAPLPDDLRSAIAALRIRHGVTASDRVGAV